MTKLFAYEVHEEFLELVCGGVPFDVARLVVGVGANTGRAWWRRCGLMDVVVQMGARGGLAGSAPAMVPGACSEGQQRSRRPLSSEDRAVIAAGLRRDLSYAQIGALICRDRSVVWREVARNRGPDGSYWGPVAHRAAHERRRRPKEFRLAQNPALARRIETWMDDGWSPKLIATILKQDHPQMIMDRVSHETIYQSLYVQGRGQLRQDLHRQLSLKRARRKSRSSGPRRNTSPFNEAYTIRDRPASDADRAVPGQWEGDLVIGAGGGSAVGTLVERTTRFTILLHLPARHDAETVAAAMIREMSDLPAHLRRGLTWDRGSELAQYRRIELALEMPVYFCDPRSPWQRGTNENTNRLLRHWLTKGSDLSVHTAADLRQIAATLNARPRPTLNLQTPAQALDKLLAKPAAA